MLDDSCLLDDNFTCVVNVHLSLGRTRIGGKRQTDLVPIPASTKGVSCSSLASERAAWGFKAKMCYL